MTAQQKLHEAVVGISASLEAQVRSKVRFLCFTMVPGYAAGVPLTVATMTAAESSILEAFCDDLARNAVQGIADLLTGEG